MILHCYIVDNEAHASQIIASYIEMTEGLELIGTELDPLTALNKISTREIRPDITFLDIDMPRISGIDLAGLIDSLTHVIFTTAFPEYAASAYEGNAVDYIIKPVSYIRFLKAVSRVRSKQELLKGAREDSNGSYFFIKTNPHGKLIKIAIEDIIIAEARHNYVELFFKDKSYLAYLTLGEVEAKLSVDRFVRVQKSFLVNLEMIRSIEGNCVTMVNGRQITIGPSYRKTFLALIQEKSLVTRRILRG